MSIVDSLSRGRCPEEDVRQAVNSSGAAPLRHKHQQALIQPIA
jgi:hypothetical protein